MIKSLQELGKSNYEMTIHFINNYLQKFLYEDICDEKNYDFCIKQKIPPACQEHCRNIYEQNAYFYYPIIINRLYYSLMLIIYDKYKLDIEKGYKKVNSKATSKEIGTYIKKGCHNWTNNLNFIKQLKDSRKTCDFSFFSVNMNQLRKIRNDLDYNRTTILSVTEFNHFYNIAKKIMWRI